MIRKKCTAVISGVMALSVILTACGATENPQTDDNDANTVSYSEIEITSLDVSSMFTDRDLDGSYDQSAAAQIELLGDSAQCQSDAVTISGGSVTIVDEGTYILSGSLNDGMIIIEAENTDKVQLVLNGVNITSATSAAIYIKQADKVFITLAEGSQNTLSNDGRYVSIDDNNIDAVIFSKDDLAINGSGSLAIDGSSAGHGIVSKDDLVITGGVFSVASAEHGLSGKDCLKIAGGGFSIVSGKDALHAENSDDASLGYIYIADGSFDLSPDGDGISAQSYLRVDGGNYNIICAGGTAAASSLAEEQSAKGLKSTGTLYLTGGSFVIDSADDAVHSNSDLAVEGGEYQISTGDDGFHADNLLRIIDGNIDISHSYEGLEGLCVEILRGQITLLSTDDGINAAGGNDQSGFGGHRADTFSSNSSSYISISGGVLFIDASGDGIDSNGSLDVSGGEIYLSGPENGANGAVDYESQGTISGGVFIAAGASQMAVNFGDQSTQGTILISFDAQPAGSDISLTDENGPELLSWQSKKSFSSVVISCPQLVQGGVYTLSAGSYTTEITLDNLVYGSGGGFGRGGVNRGTMPSFDGETPEGGRPNFDKGDAPEAPNGQGKPPEGMGDRPRDTPQGGSDNQSPPQDDIPPQ